RVVELFGVELRCRLNLVLAEYANSPTSVGIRISESGWNRLSVVSALASVRLSVHLFRSAPESWVLHKGLIEGGGLPDVTPPKPELVSFVEKGGELSPLSMRLVRERERETPLALPEEDFILTGEEVACTFGLAPVVTSSMVESYGEPVSAVVWGEDMVCHAALMARGGGVG
ncbi:hypothetical protein BHM03_00043544, partial [Ensete ventricosum]